MPTLEWIGKDKVVNHHQEIPYCVQERQYSFSQEGLSYENNGSENMIIHGDNLQALKSLLPKYEGRVKCIYIDPPYNTGNENWIYNDNVNDPKIKKWLGEIVGKEGEDLSRHDKWLCMMYPRLKLLQKLLADNGYIYISINYLHESAHLRCICDEIFGSNNFIGELTWESTTQPINSGSARFNLQQKVEPILFYAKNKNYHNGFILKEIENSLKYPHEGKLGSCRFEIIEKSDAGSYKRDTMKFEILGQLPREGKRWQIGYDTAVELEKNNRLELVDGIIKKAVYPEDEFDKRKFVPFWSHFSANQVGTAQSGKELLNTIMERAIGFDTVKPPALIEELLSHFDKDCIILDSFAGSGTTAHAVLNMNKSDGGNRKFILIEMEDYADSITAERVKRVIDGYGEGEGTGGDFSYYELGEPLLLPNGNLNENVDVQKIREYVYYMETKGPLPICQDADNKYHLGRNKDTVYYFYYEKNEVTTLDHAFLATVGEKADGYIIYANLCTLSESELKEYNITFKKIPRDIARL